MIFQGAHLVFYEPAVSYGRPCSAKVCAKAVMGEQTITNDEQVGLGWPHADTLDKTL